MTGWSSFRKKWCTGGIKTVRKLSELFKEELVKNQADIEIQLKENLTHFSELEYSSDGSGVKAVFSVVKNKLMRPGLYRTWLKGLTKVSLIELTETSDIFEWKFPVKINAKPQAKISDSVIRAVTRQQEELESFL